MTQGLEDFAAASRRHPRARVNLPTELAISGQDGESDESRCIELSIGGMRVVRSAGLGPGTPVRVRVELGEDADLDLDARVVWSADRGQEHELGLAFENPPTAESSLATLVAELRAQHSWGPAAL